MCTGLNLIFNELNHVCIELCGLMHYNEYTGRLQKTSLDTCHLFTAVSNVKKTICTYISSSLILHCIHYCDCFALHRTFSVSWDKDVTAVHIGSGCINTFMHALSYTHKAAWHFCMHTVGVLGGGHASCWEGRGPAACTCVHHKC